MRVVGREEEAAFVGDECLAYFFSVLIADGNVLQVWIARTEASGGCNRLVERRMYPPRVWIDKLGKGIDIGSEELFESAVFENLFYYGMPELWLL